MKIVNAASEKEVSDRTKLGVAPPIQLPCECIKWKQKGHDLEEKDSKGRKLPRNMVSTYTVAHYHCMIMFMNFNLSINLAVKFNVTDSPSLSLMKNAKQIQPRAYVLPLKSLSPTQSKIVLCFKHLTLPSIKIECVPVINELIITPRFASPNMGRSMRKKSLQKLLPPLLSSIQIK